jgi:hypothetical protein
LFCICFLILIQILSAQDLAQPVEQTQRSLHILPTVSRNSTILRNSLETNQQCLCFRLARTVFPTEIPAVDTRVVDTRVADTLAVAPTTVDTLAVGTPPADNRPVDIPPADIPPVDNPPADTRERIRIPRRQQQPPALRLRLWLPPHSTRSIQGSNK